MNNQLGRDLISDLPVGIIENILIRVPIRDAIRTSILSIKWRHKWTSLPHLVFEEYTMVYSSTHSMEDATYEKCIQNFVSRTLFRHQGHIHKFKLDESSFGSFPEIDEWLLLLSRKDIKELILGVVDSETPLFCVPCSLYSCRNLTYLELFGCEFDPPPPTFKGFLCLRTLILRFPEVHSGTIESIVAHSPLLENLECTNIGCSELRISAPNLKYVCIESTPKEIYVCAPLLAKMVITLDEEYKYTREEYDDLAELLQQKGSFCNYTKFLGGLTNLESLTGENCFTKYLSIGIEYWRHPLVFHHLKDITLTEVDFRNVNETLVVIRLIMGAPNLHELQVNCLLTFKDEDEDEVKAPPIDLWDSECPQTFILEKLKVIKMTEFHGLYHEIKFIKFLLESSSMLEKITVQPYYVSNKKKLKLIVELLGHCRASTNAKILFD